ncbi:MAG: SurA N-terminal domain-containing protein [Caldimonas sp.]
MFEFFRRHTRALQFLLVVLIFPSFVFFGIQGYSRFSGGDLQTVARVAGQSVTQGELDAALRERVERARRQMPSLDAKLFETPEMRSLALDGVIRDRLTLAASDKLHLGVSDERLDRAFKNDPEYAPLRNPDGSINRDTLTALGMSSEAFAERLRQDLARRQVMQPLGNSAIAPAAAASAALEAMYQQREVQVERFDAKDQLAKARPSDAEVEAYYKDPAHGAEFQAPEQASVEYLTLDLETVKKTIAVSEEDLRKYYAENEKRYTSAEERRASHILVKADKDAAKAERDKARAKAEGLLAEVRKNPQAFAEIARKNSDDEGSAANGGDLDFFGRGAMVKPFEDAAFGLKPGETSGVVESDFGFHIIHVTGARGGEKKSFEAVRVTIESEVRNQLVQKKFADAAVEFGDTVYEQPDSLKPAADKWKLEIKTAQRVARAPLPGASGALANPRFLEALFSSETTRDKRNTKAIDVGSNQLAAGRIVQYAPAHQLAFAEVKERVRQQLAARQAGAFATRLGEERLVKARATPAESFAGEAVVVSRAQPRDLPRPVLDAALKAPVATLPAFVGVPLGDQGYAVVKIIRTAGRDPVVADPTKAMAQYAQVWAEAEAQAYYAALKARFKVSVSPGATAPRDAASEPR